ncbi:MAG: hypothetical protein R3C56_04305 [Pirellulaceae bacterium]
MSVGECRAITDFTTARGRTTLPFANSPSFGEPVPVSCSKRPPLRKGPVFGIVAFGQSTIRPNAPLCDSSLSHPERGREQPGTSRLAIIESDLIGIELPDDNQPLLQVCSGTATSRSTLFKPTLILTHEGPLRRLPPLPTTRVAQALAKRGFKMLNEDDLTRLSHLILMWPDARRRISCLSPCPLSTLFRTDPRELDLRMNRFW